MADPTRATAYADLLTALLAVRADPATERFDAEIAEAEAAGTLDGATARTLRWWQRESVRGLSDHLVAVLPDLLARLEQADLDAGDAVADSAESWASATAPPPVEPEPVAPTGLDVSSVTSEEPAHPFGLRPAPPADPAPSAADSGGTGAPRVRLLVAGLTVLSDGGGPDTAPPVPMP